MRHLPLKKKIWILSSIGNLAIVVLFLMTGFLITTMTTFWNANAYNWHTHLSNFSLK
jgi:predicted anti-sigma-YlaC factor YlaD